MSRLVDRLVRKVTEEDIEVLARNLSDEDRVEVELSHGVRDFKANIAESVKISEEALAGWVDGQLVAIWGVRRESIITRSGVPWMLTTDAIQTHPILVARSNRLWIDDVKRRYAFLHNYVHEGNKTAKKWLQWLGFTLSDPAPFGPVNAPFHYFYMRGDQ